MELMVLIFGFIFGAIIQYASLNKYNTISGLATLENLAVAKAIALAIGIGSILLSITIGFDYATFHVKPFILGGIVLGGLIFGSGMAILGYCPGTLAISVGEGALDALIGILGALLGGWVFTLMFPSFSQFLGPNLGNISLNSLMGSGWTFYALTAILGILFATIAFWLNKFEKIKDNKWVYAGIALAILNTIIFLKATNNRPIGASTTFPYLADLLIGTTQNDYFNQIKPHGAWEAIFLAGAFIAGLIVSLIKKGFKLTLIYSNWEKYRGKNKNQRIFWAFFGGFLLIFGARMAGGCTSGHILSGGMQLSISSLVFAVFTFIGLLVTGKYFYLKK